MTVAETIKAKLTEALSPVSLTIIDESSKHAGHAGAPAGGESHFQVEIVADAFNGVSRVERQRLVYTILADELAGPVHALALRTVGTDEAN